MEHQVVANVEQALADLQQAVGTDIDRRTGEPVTGGGDLQIGKDKESSE